MVDDQTRYAVGAHGDPGRAFILAGNGLILVLAWWRDWTLTELLIPYLIESLVIGWFTTRRMLRGAAEQLPYRMKGGEITTSQRDRYILTLGVAVFFGLANLLYFDLLGGMDVVYRLLGSERAMSTERDVSWLAVVGLLTTVVMMVRHHQLAGRRWLVPDRRQPVDLYKVMETVVMRIGIVHLSILVGGAMMISFMVHTYPDREWIGYVMGKSLIAMFVTGKTIADFYYDRLSRLWPAEASSAA